MTPAIDKRHRLLLSCGAMALAGGLALVSQAARAQAIQANPTVTQGTAIIDRSVPGEDTIAPTTPTVIIDWDPFEDGLGNALDFLPTGTFAIFQDVQGIGDFAILNRILPSANGNVAVIDGTVLSLLQDPAGGTMPGGFVAFYSPTGILIGPNATFDVGSLLLTTLDPDPASFTGFSTGGTMNLIGAQGTTASIVINPGAQVVATQENSFFVASAAEVQMFGTSDVNGSQAYIAGEVVNLTFSNGLFDIQVPVGTQSGAPIQLNGDVGGPSSVGAGDNHIIYAVARAANNPIGMLFGGNLGFAPAAAAGVVNGEIILSANYDVSGRTVDGGSIVDGINAIFGANSETSNVQADIVLDDFNATSSLLAISTGTVQADNTTGNSAVDGNLLLVGRQSAALAASNGNQFTVSGDVLVSARDTGLIEAGIPFANLLNAQAGMATVEAVEGAVLNIGGNVQVTADAEAGADSGVLLAGTATGGTALLNTVNGGTINIAGSTIVSAQALGPLFDGLLTGATVTGGDATVMANSGPITIGQDLAVRADAVARDSENALASTGSNALAGDAMVDVLGGGSLNVVGNAMLTATAVAGASNQATQAALADAGEASITVTGDSLVQILGAADFDARAVGADNFGAGQGGNALGGIAGGETFNGGSLTIAGDFVANGGADAGDGTSGGNAAGGIAGARALTGQIDLQGNVNAMANAQGGNALVGFGGNGGDAIGGLAQFIAIGSPTNTASIAIAGFANVDADGRGGTGGQGGGGLEAGRGGDGEGGRGDVVNQADPAAFGGALILASGDNGSVSVGGLASLNAQGTGGMGGNGDLGAIGGDGGDGNGGLTQVGTDLFGGTGATGGGVAAFADIGANSNGTGGDGGAGGSTTDPTGAGGTGTGGDSFLNANVGNVTAGAVLLAADGAGGQGGTGGDGFGGQSGILGSLDAAITVAGLNASAIGIGGAGIDLAGGAGTGGEALVSFEDLDITVNGDLALDAMGVGGLSTGADGGAGTGGTAGIANNAGTIGTVTVTGNASVTANGFGGATDNGFVGGLGTGGEGFVEVQSAATATLGSLQVTASGLGGTGANAAGGAGIGGSADLRVNGIGSQLTIQNNVPAALVDPLNGGAIVAANGIGGDATGGTGVGGTGNGGSVEVLALQGGAIDFPLDPGAVGAIGLLAEGTGGGSSVDGGAGGTGNGGTGLINVDGGTAAVGPSTFSVASTGGSSLNANANISGGTSNGGTRTITIANGGILTAELSGGTTGGTGGAGSGTGDGGDATGGTNTVGIDNGTLALMGRSVFATQATGGAGNQGGAATGGQVNFTANAAAITLAANALGEAELVIGGQTAGGGGTAQGGSASGTAANLTLNASTLNGGALTLDGSAIADNGTATAGSAQASIDGDSTVNTTTISISSAAQTSANGTAQGGTSSLQIGAMGNPQVSATNLALNADATGGDSAALANTAGRFAVDVSAGDVAVQTLTASALGDAASGQLAEPTLNAAGGSILVSDTATINVVDDLVLNTGAGELIGGPSLADPTVALAIASQGTVTVTGADAGVVGLSGLSLALSARELNVEQGAVVGAPTLVLTSLDTQNAAILGGGSEEAGFTLTQNEFDRLQVTDFTFNGPLIDSTDDNQPDIILRDLAISGSLANGFASFAILGDAGLGLIRTEGMLALSEAGQNDTLRIASGDRIEVVTPGGVTITDTNDLPSGILQLEATNIWAADAALIAQLQADPAFAGRDDTLATALAGSADPLGYLRGGTVQIAVAGSLLVRNTGTTTAQGGILVGDGGLSIALAPNAPNQQLLDVFAYGRRAVVGGTFITGEAFFNEVNFNRIGGNPTLYTDTSEFNDCVINTGECPTTAVAPIVPQNPIAGAPVAINSSTIIEAPILTVGALNPTPIESDFDFGVDFPGLIEAPLLSEDPLLEDPVASGGDASLYVEDNRTQGGEAEGGDDGE